MEIKFYLLSLLDYNQMKFFLPIVLFILIFSACKKKSTGQDAAPGSGHAIVSACPKPAMKLTDPEMVQCKYRPGSFWVYTDSISNSKDTLYVDSLKRMSGYMPFVGNGPCDSAEVFDLKMRFKNEKEAPLKTFHYLVYQLGVLYVNDYRWTVGGSDQGSPIFYLANKHLDSGYRERDSVFIYNKYYKKVGESDEYKLTTTIGMTNETKMFHYTVKSYFNAEFGPVQFDFYDFLSHELKRRYKLVACNIIR